MQILNDYKNILSNGIVIKSSGTSGTAKEYFQSPEKLSAANKIAIDVQKILPSSRIYTCCKINHAGGLLAQTLPALSIGAQVDLVDFNPYNFIRSIHNYTHTHITPKYAKAIMRTKSFQYINFSNLHITCGADPVTWDIIEAFVSRGATFTANWGMSEIGPIAINVTFNSLDDVARIRLNSDDTCTILGDSFYCDYKIENNELLVRGDICIYNDWYKTNDTVISKNGMLYYTGRKNILVDLWNPTK